MENKMKEDKKRVFRPRFTIVILVAIILAQTFYGTYSLKKKISLQKFEDEKRLSEVSETMNIMSIMQDVLVNILVEKDVLDRSQLLNEAQKMSVELKNKMDRTKANEKYAQEKKQRDSYNQK
jgi:hypothetical protein